MTSRTDELTRDPLFQLNMLLWLAQPQPQWGHGGIRPLFYEQGFTVHAIAPLFSAPLDLLLLCRQRGINIRERVRPDAVLAREKDGRFAFAECKASSFGAASSTAEQARTLLLVSGPRSAEVLGLAPGKTLNSILGFFLPDQHRVPMAETLDQLDAELISQGLPASHFSVVGLAANQEQLYLQLDDKGAEFFSLPTGPVALMDLDVDTDPRPLYFVPFDPDLDQTPEEKAFCKRILFERLQGSLIAAVGRGRPPFALPVELPRLLNDATFGMFEQWENRETHRHLMSLSRQLLAVITKEVDRTAPGVMSYSPGEGWRIVVKDDELHQQLMDALTRFSCETLELKTDPQFDLFEELEHQPGGTE